MGSGNSRNAVVSSTVKERNEPQRSGRWRLFHSRCFGPFTELPDNAGNSVVQPRSCERPVVPATRAQVPQQAKSGKQLNTQNVKASESRDLHESKSSVDCNERSGRRHFKPVSNASSSSVQGSIVPEFESSTSFANHSSTRRKANKYTGNNYHSNFPSSDTDHSNAQSSRTVSSRPIELEAYSVFASRFTGQCSNVDLDQGFNVDHFQNGTTRQMHGNGLCAASETRHGQHRSRSVQWRYANLSFNAREQRDASCESSSMIHNDYRGLGEAIPSNNDQDVSILGRSSSMRMESREARRIQSRYGTPEHIERNAIRRTHSVGHLLDGTPRRQSAEGLFTMLDGYFVDGQMRWHNRRRLWDSLRRSSSHRQIGTQVASGQDQFFRTLRSLSDNQRRNDGIYQISQDTITESTNLVNQRSLFSEERRQRARSQVRALQHLSNNFGNLAGHERSCILAGHYHTGRCSCENVGRTDESNTRASISRIIMLAEALFEVLDEIHSQSMALSSRPSVASLGPFPAPDYVVESMPMRIYKGLEIVSNVEPAQCYICLMEYEEGDHMRVLPCHHEFHLACIDKWLKEIHRVCPLCRGNVCDVGSTAHIRAP